MKLLNLIAIFILFHVHGIAQTIKISEDIELIKLSENIYQHKSYFTIETFGRVDANGLVVINNKKALLVDTPFTEEQTKELVQGIEKNLGVKITSFIASHWHGDCIGGLNYLHKKGIKSYAYDGTIEITKENKLPVPQNGFQDSLTINLNNLEIKSYFLGGGHSTDNIVIWIPSERILFGGCLIKDVTATNLGNLSDADVPAWPSTIDKVKNKFANAKIIIPGHGANGRLELLEHTESLLSKQGSEK